MEVIDDVVYRYRDVVPLSVPIDSVTSLPVHMQIWCMGVVITSAYRSAVAWVMVTRYVPYTHNAHADIPLDS